MGDPLMLMLWRKMAAAAAAIAVIELIPSPAAAQTSMTIGNLINNAPAVTTPFGPADKLLIIQAGAEKSVTPGQLAGNLGAGNMGTLTVAGGTITGSTVFAVGTPSGAYAGPGISLGLVSATGALNGLIGQVDNNVSYATNPFLAVGTTGAAYIPSGVASVAFGLYGLGEIHNAQGSIVGGEVTVRNFGGVAASSAVPTPIDPTTNLIATGWQVTCGSSAGAAEKDCSIGIGIGNETGGSNPADAAFANGLTINAYRNFGIYVQQGYPTGNQTTAQFDNNGNGVNLVLRTVGTFIATANVLTVKDGTNVLRAQMRQNGDFIGNNFLAAAGQGFWVGSSPGLSGTHTMSAGCTLVFSGGLFIAGGTC